jgi:hypothetical protein
LAGRPFDLIFSNFGGLNCLSPEETRALAGRLHALLRPGGRLFLVYMSRKCLWEQLYHLLKGLPEKARRRLDSGPVAAKLGGETVEVWYYDPRELAGLFHPHFRQTGLYPIGLFTPPSYLEDFFKRRRRSLGVLAALDRLVPFPALANYADHFAIAFRKI